MNKELLSRLDRFRLIALVVGLIGLVLCAVGAFVNTQQFFISFLYGSLSWLGLALGCFGVAMIHHLTGGRWGQVTRRFLEAGFMTLPVMAFLFAPICFGLKFLYPWAQPTTVADDIILQHRQAYMNPAMFVVRAVIAFIIWMVITQLLRKWSLQQDTTRDVEPTRRLRSLSGPGIVLYPLTATFVYVDWIMSLEPHWYSTMFVVIICIGQILAAYALCIILLSWFGQFKPLSEVVTATHFHHLGNLLLTFVMFWTYVSFGQLLIIWSGNLPDETVWYLHRIAGGWKGIVWFLFLFHFFLPFFILLFRNSKRNPQALMMLATIVFVAHFVSVYWFIAPSFYPTGFHVSWLDFAALFGVGGLWVATFISLLMGPSLIPLNDPRVEHQIIEAHAK
ncbi:hypothetical protein [Pedosphaera parvula]|uniref:Quinol:cytochrome c oxidoreductase quinone-binding subunit 2 n=1 Tax=Pedosphaera parvula (strain Ellin514) TaxID=320771 RepID=B9XE54_PEDPL|nr:hypothetical protein [Pedosphaera parvula]EEF61945.1 conserved hypothetical protein [Pedosphaera parvula Ellin514]